MWGEERMKDWKFTKKIEDMSPEETRERIREGYEYPMPELFIMPYLGEDELVTYRTKDFCARCPATGIADVYDLTISFVPDGKIPELKSLKLYFNAYQDLPISHEHVASKIYEDFLNQVKPKELDLKLVAAVRGGIETIVDTSSSSNGKDKKEK